jgi:hypothetical protein
MKTQYFSAHTSALVLPSAANHRIKNIFNLNKYKGTGEDSPVSASRSFRNDGRLHETFRFISVTTPRTVSRTPWTGDQLVARPLLTAPGDCDDGGAGKINGFGRGNRSRLLKKILFS